MTYSWKCSDSKGIISDNSAQETILTNTYKNGIRSVTTTLSCKVYDSTSKLSSFELTKEIKLKKKLI